MVEFYSPAQKKQTKKQNKNPDVPVETVINSGKYYGLC